MKVQRNDPCLCGSGKKHKRCCGARVPREEITGSGSKTTSPKICSFSCEKDCSKWCCGGATLVTVSEIKSCYRLFPITIGFRTYLPVDTAHRDFLESVGMKIGNRYVVGDFIAGNRYRKSCVALDKNGLCRLHKKEQKPAQCQLVPFCALFPEDKQDSIFMDQKKTTFSHCKGFRDTDAMEHAVWKDGRFIDQSYRHAFYAYRRGLKEQKPIMQKVFEELRGQQSHYNFLQGEGILEAHIPLSLLFDVLEMAGLRPDEYQAFLSDQRTLCHRELVVERIDNPVLDDYLTMLNKIAELYAEFLRKQKGC